MLIFYFLQFLLARSLGIHSLFSSNWPSQSVMIANGVSVLLCSVDTRSDVDAQVQVTRSVLVMDDELWCMSPHF